MLSLFDTPSLERALSLPLDRKVRGLLQAHVDHLDRLDLDVRDTTYFLVIDAGCAMEDVTDELGWSPLVNPIDGQRYGDAALHPFHEALKDRGGWFEMHVCVGNEAVFILFIRDSDRAPPDLVAFCREFVTD
ncbi:hypothetical protein [Sphingomonas yabuuchiae]|uniref:Uncharacterized protein n=1 Tax=Sphingomonas yabuuchiae TaxID=172044 RepID=A0AA40ZXB6_9SPHN|nr:hypothetical protein [Sphingomonas yabuuchiae]MBB4609798.1 hypothetical protein [Sphingomonas yabuuchiae]MBN3558110.1 hypothetical protein [Sphingomonas yabuuchiae]